MTIWKLNPIDLNHRDWEASTYRREVIVRAESEKRARQIATSAFHIATTVTPGEKIKSNPWSQTALVSAVEVKDGSYPETGKEEILGPEEARGYNDA
jgi:hypothetical protein